MAMSKQCRSLHGLEKTDAPPNIANIVVPTCLSLKKLIAVDILETAVTKYAHSQPNLCSGIMITDNDVCFKPIDPDFNDYFEILSSDQDWEEVCKKYSNAPINEDYINKPQFRVFYLPPKLSSNSFIGHAYLIPVYSHHVGDGTNGMTIVNDILCIYEQIKNNCFDYPAMHPAPSAVEMAKSYFYHAFNNDNKKAQNVLTEKQEEFTEHYLEMYDKLNYFLPSEKYNKTVALYHLSSSDIYEKFLLKCKEKNVTVGATFIAITYFAFASFAFQEKFQDSPDELFINCNVPINLRNRVPLTIPKNCVNVGICQNFITPVIKQNTSIWDFVDTVKQCLMTIFEKKFNLFDYDITKKLKSHSIAKFIQRYGTDHQFTVSNMLKYPHSREYEDFVLESIHCVGGLWLPSWDHMELMIYSTDKFNLSLVHKDGIKNTKIAKYIFSLIIYLTENISKLDDKYILQHLIESNPIEQL